MYAFKPNQLSNFAQWGFFKDVFTPEECKLITSLFDNKAPASANVAGGAGGENKKIRQADLTWLSPTVENLFIFDRLASLSRQANAQFWNFQLSGFYEPLQLTRYKKGQFYSEHQDIGPGELSKRKLSIVIQLSDPKKYKGGQLEFPGFEKEQEKVLTGIGSAIVFPSYNPHRVSKLTSGERFSLVAWVTGEPFK